MNTSRGVKLPAGAGRTFHMIYPQVGQSRTTAGALGTTGTFRPGPTQTAVISAGTRGTGAQSFSGAVQGAAPVTLAAPAATDASNVKFTSTSFYPILEQLASNPVGNPAQVYRFLVMAAFPLLPGNIGASSDLGLVLVTANNSFVTDGVHPGVTFGPVGANAIGLRAYKTGANTFTRDLAPAAVAAGLDYTKFNLWELRLTNATATAPAQLKSIHQRDAIWRGCRLLGGGRILPAHFGWRRWVSWFRLGIQ
jgi:hypothetical protein